MRNSLLQLLAGVAIVTLAKTPLVSAALIGHWTLDNDTTGLQNLGTNGAASNLVAASPLGAITGGPTFSATGGAVGGHATFNGTQALIGNLSGNAAEFLNDYPFTLSAWIRAAATQVDRGAVIGIINRGAQDQYMSIGTRTTAEGNDFQAVRRNGGFVQTDAPGTKATLMDGDWHHLAAVYSGASNLQIYLDGKLVNEATSPAVTFPSGINTIGIGAMRRSTSFIDRFSGDIDDVRIYDTALTAEQVQSLVPEPATLSMAAVAICAMAFIHRIRRPAGWRQLHV